MMRQLLLSTLLLAGSSALALAADSGTNGIAVTDLWARATPPGASTGAVYATITDTGAPDRLMSVSTPIAASASVHESETVNGVTQMRPVEALAIDPKAPTKLAPGGYHVMLEGLKQPLKAADQFPLTLTFEHAGAVTTMVTVRPLGTAASVGNAMKDMDMSHMAPGH